MRDRWRFCKRSAARMVGGLGLMLLLQLAPQVSLAAAEFACEYETNEVIASGCSRRNVLVRHVPEARVIATSSHVDKDELRLASSLSPRRHRGHRLPNGNCSPLRC